MLKKTNDRKKGLWVWRGSSPLFDANERRNGFPALNLQSVSPLQHAPLPRHCDRTKLQAWDPITWNFSREAAIVWRRAAGERLGRRGSWTGWKGGWLGEPPGLRPHPFTSRLLLILILLVPLLVLLFVHHPSNNTSVFAFAPPLWGGVPKVERGKAWWHVGAQ